MVSFEEIQAAYNMVAATGVIVAAIFYVLNMRETTRNRRISLTRSMMETFSSVEGYKRLLQLMYMKWDDFDDFMKKYDSTVNPENAAIRNHVWDALEVIGHQWREGILDKNTIYDVIASISSNLWVKFKPIIEMYRKTELGEDAYDGWEYLAKEIAKIKSKRAPGYKGLPGVVKPEEYEKTYGI